VPQAIRFHLDLPKKVGNAQFDGCSGGTETGGPVHSAAGEQALLLLINCFGAGRSIGKNTYRSTNKNVAARKCRKTREIFVFLWTDIFAGLKAPFVRLFW
jgi:hypothetical protein